MSHRKTDLGIRPRRTAKVVLGRVLINAQIAAGYALAASLLGHFVDPETLDTNAVPEFRESATATQKSIGLPERYWEQYWALQSPSLSFTISAEIEVALQLKGRRENAVYRVGHYLFAWCAPDKF
jgi:hypothetical protein